MKTWKVGDIIGLTLVIVLGFFLSACGSTTTETPVQSSLKIAQVFQGTLGDEGYNDAMYDGAMRAQQEFGISYEYVESWAYPDMEGYLRDYTEAEEYELIIVGSFPIEWALKQMAAEFPDQKFLSFNAMVESPNVISYGFVSEEAFFLAGLIGGQLTETGTIGFITGTDNPYMDHNLAGYEAGLRWFRPDGQIIFDFVGSWTDTLKAKELALAQYGQGADIILNIGSPLGVIDAAREEGKYIIGFMDVRHLAPDEILLSVAFDMEGLTYSTIRDLQEGKFEPVAEYVGLADGAIFMSEDMHPLVTQEIIARVDEIAEKVASGEIVLPEGSDFVDDFLAQYAIEQ
jgi:basic membrane protein A